MLSFVAGNSFACSLKPTEQNFVFWHFWNRFIQHTTELREHVRPTNKSVVSEFSERKRTAGRKWNGKSIICQQAKKCMCSWKYGIIVTLFGSPIVDNFSCYLWWYDEWKQNPLEWHFLNEWSLEICNLCIDAMLSLFALFFDWFFHWETTREVSILCLA